MGDSCAICGEHGVEKACPYATPPSDDIDRCIVCPRAPKRVRMNSEHPRFRFVRARFDYNVMLNTLIAIRMLDEKCKVQIIQEIVYQYYKTGCLCSSAPCNLCLNACCERATTNGYHDVECREHGTSHFSIIRPNCYLFSV